MIGKKHGLLGTRKMHTAPMGNDVATEKQLRHACVELEGRLRAGVKCHAEEYLVALPALAQDVDRAVDLIYTEFLTRLELGQRDLAEQFCARFPAWQDYLRQQFAVHDWLRQSVAPTPLPVAAPPAVGESSGTWQPATRSAASVPTSAASWPQQYELLGEIARGGMGVVYKARQVGLNRLVALKMLKGESAPVGEALARFRAEAAIIAKLDDPHIVRIHEIGEWAGQPYLALEYVSGGSLAQLLTKGPLAPWEAAHLVETVARAVQIAHQNGILHRDLKPGNILLSGASGEGLQQPTTTEEGTTAGQPGETPARAGSTEQDVRLGAEHAVATPPRQLIPKLTDFGLAKQIDAPEAHTRTGAVVGTPAYMAPEQVTGQREKVGPATDLYALGVVLYETLTGRPPFQAAHLMDLFEDITTREPVPPTRLQPKVPRDLETICLKCLQKEPAHRYASATDLADDLQRFRQGEPIRARAISRTERAWRWCRRNPIVAGLGTLLAVSLLAGTILSTTFWWQASHNLSKMQQEYARAEQHYREMLDTVNEYFTTISRSPQLQRPGLEPLRLDLLSKAMTFLQTVLRQRGQEPQLRAEIGRAKFVLAELYDLQGKLVEAEAISREAQLLHQELVREHPENKGMRHRLALSLTQHANCLARLSRFAEAQVDFAQGIALFEELARATPEDKSLPRNLARMLHNQGAAYLQVNALEAAYPLFDRARQLLEAQRAAEPDEDRHCLDLAKCLTNLAGILQRQQRYPDSISHYEQGLQIMTQLRQRHPGVPAHDREYARILNVLGLLHTNLGQSRKAVPLLQQAEQLLRKLVAENPDNREFRTGLAYSLGYLGETFMALRQHNESLLKLQASYLAFETLRKEQPFDQVMLQYAWKLYRAYAQALRTAGRPEEALTPGRQAVESLVELHRTSPREVQYLQHLGGSWNDLALTYKDLLQWDQSCDACQQAIHYQRQALAAKPENVQVRLFLSTHLLNLGAAEQGRGRTAAALAAVGTFQELWPADGTKQVDAARQYAKYYAALGQPTPGPEGDALRERCAQEVVQALRHALRLGFRNSGEIRTDKLYDPLRQRADFQAVYRALEELAKDATTTAPPSRSPGKMP